MLEFSEDDEPDSAYVESLLGMTVVEKDERLMNKTTAWRKSTFSNDQSACVEINGTLDAVRDTKNHGPELRLAGQALPVLIYCLKDDLLAP